MTTSQNPAMGSRVQEVPRRDTYQEWMDRQEVPIIHGHFATDLNTLPLGDWKNINGRGAIMDFIGAERTTGSMVIEIPPGGSLTPMRHMYEQDMYVLAGRGATTVWQEQGKEVSFEWQAGSLFSTPLNANYQLHNGQGDAPARLVAVNTMPLLLMYFRDEAFIFDNPYVFTDRFNGQQAFFAEEGKMIGSHLLETNFVPDARTLQLYDLEERGGRGNNITFELGGNTFGCHISDFAPGNYKKGHRHGGGAHIIILSGEGYSLMWPDDGEKVRVDWKPGAFFSPPDIWWHQHFNVSDVPARYLAFRWGSRKYRMPRLFQPEERLAGGRSQIEYDEEEPEIRQMFDLASAEAQQRKGG
jgi:quercetin dioxygenase-like cupin family protein